MAFQSPWISVAVQGSAAPKAVLQQCCRAFNLLWTTDSAVQGHAAAVPTQVPSDRKPPVRENSSAIWGQVLGTLGGAPPDPGSNMVSARAAAVCCVQCAVHQHCDGRPWCHPGGCSSRGCVLCAARCALQCKETLST